MKLLSRYIVLIFVLSFGNRIAIAQEPLTKQPNIPASSWEQHPEGIALAINLITQTETGNQESFVQVYIKNLSSASIQVIDSEIDFGIEVYYLDGQGTEIPLHNYHPDPDESTYHRKMRHIVIGPSDVILRTVRLTPDELVVIKAHLSKCSFIIYDPTNKRQFAIESSPKYLTETASK
jgi:hypothetical protein